MPPGGGGIGRPDADNGRALGGGGIGRPEAEKGPGGRGGGGVDPGAKGRAGGAGGRAAVVGGIPAGVAGRGAPGVGRPLEMKPLRADSPAASVGAGPGAGASVAAGSVTVGASAAGASMTVGVSTTTGASTTGASMTAGASTSVTSVTAVSGVADFFAAAFFGAAFLAAAFFAGFSVVDSDPSAVLAAAFFGAAFFAAAFFSGLGSSGCSSRMRPSRSARRRTRSACASMIDDEWLFTSIPITTQRSTASLLVRPSSLASSWTRMFFGNLTSAFHYRFIEGPYIEVLTGPRVGCAQRAPEIAAIERSVDACRTAAQPRASTVGRPTNRRATIDDDETHE